ncbi:MAG TPA: PilN domain-containing protein [Nevskiaceae bacterium]|nr:PilN domain-containing protein [Nevskiaceae bacterium]
MTTRINLLDWRAKRRELRLRQFIVIMGTGAAVAALAVLGSWLAMGNAIEAQEQRNAYLKQQIAEMDQKITEIQELEKVKSNLLSRMRVIEELQASRSATVHFFDELVKTLPEGVSLVSVKQTGPLVRIEGVAESNGRVSSYMKNLDASDWFNDPKLVVIKTTERNRLRQSEFTLTVKRLNRPGQVSEGVDEEFE